MLIEEALYTLIKGNLGVIAIAEQRIFPVKMPQLEKGKTSYPAIVYKLENRVREYSHDGPNALVKSQIGIYPIGPNYFQVKTLADKVRLAVNGKTQELANIYGQHVRGVFLENEVDDDVFDEVEELGLYVVPMEFLIHHKEEN